MEHEQAMGIIRQSARQDDMKAKLELQNREQIVELIDKGYFDPILGLISDRANQRITDLADAANVLVKHFRKD